MEPQINGPQGAIESLKKVTPVSKYLAMVLFIVLPFLGGWIGYTLAPEKIVEIERVVENEKIATNTVTPSENQLQLHFIDDESGVLIFDYQSDNPLFSFNNGIFTFQTFDSERPYISIRSETIKYNKYLVNKDEWTAFALYEGGRGGPPSGSIFTISRSSGTEHTSISAVTDFEWLSKDEYRYKQSIKCSSTVNEPDLDGYAPAVPLDDGRCDVVDMAQVYPSFDSDWIYGNF